MTGTGTITVRGCRIAYRHAGESGTPVVFLHGGGIDDADLSWRHVLPAFGDRRLYAPDWPGYGDSTDGTVHSTANYVSVLEEFLDALGLERVALAGISMGGAAALGFALGNPDRVDRLALVSSYGLGGTIPAGPFWKATAHLPGSNAVGWNAAASSRAATRAALGAVVADPGELPAEFLAAVRERASRPDAGLAFEAFQRNELAADGTPRTDYADELDGLRAPTLLVHGREDPLFPVEASIRAAERLPDARLEILERCGHWPTRERPERTAAILRAFFAE